MYISLNNTIWRINIISQFFLGQNRQFFCLYYLKNEFHGEWFSFYEIFLHLIVFKPLSLPGISHSLGSRLYLVLLPCWCSVRSHSPPCIPLATRSHFYSYHTTHIHLFCWQYTTVFSTCPTVQPAEIVLILSDSDQKFLGRSRNSYSCSGKTSTAFPCLSIIVSLVDITTLYIETESDTHKSKFHL